MYVCLCLYVYVCVSLSAPRGQVDLTKLNITNYGDLSSGELGDCANDKLEAFYSGEVCSVCSLHTHLCMRIYSMTSHSEDA